jgi:FtsP/CotA-like multicopper oxidase with cupredoxin domain
MRTIDSKATRLLALRAACFLSFAAVAAFGQQQINLTAGPAPLTLPDGNVVPMWGYSCGAAVSGSTATCVKSNPGAPGWSPVVITVPTGQSLTINLTNNLPNPVPTSLVIVGQLGGGLGTAATSQPSPSHSNAQGATTWPIAGTGATGTPPAQVDRVQSFSTEVAHSATTALTWTTPRAGTYLLESGTHPSIQGPMGLYGMLVVTNRAATAIAPNTAYPGVTYSADVPLLLSEIDPIQNAAVDKAVNTSGFLETAVWSGKTGDCGDASVHSCYPPAVNYTPLYYLFNGVAFDKTHASASLFPAFVPTTATTGKVLVRLVNAGLRMHVPAIVGTLTGTPAVPGMSLIAEDGNPLPGVPRVQNEVFLAAGKTFDVMINAPAAGAPALPVFDRQLSLYRARRRHAGLYQRQ